jgi:hypothetical protein
MHLVFQNTLVATPLFNRFLYDHGERLQSLICECVTLRSVEDDESDDDDEADDDKISGQDAKSDQDEG